MKPFMSRGGRGVHILSENEFSDQGQRGVFESTIGMNLVVGGGSTCQSSMMRLLE